MDGGRPAQQLRLEHGAARLGAGLSAAVRAVACALCLLLLTARCAPAGAPEPPASRGWGQLAADDTAIFWLAPGEGRLYRVAPDGALSAVLDAGSRAGRLLASSGHLLWSDERGAAWQVDGGRRVAVGPAGSLVIDAHGRLAALWTPGGEHALWDFVVGAHVATLSGNFTGVGFGPTGSVFAAQCPYRADQEGLEPAVLRLDADAGRFEPFALGSCPLAWLRDGDQLYVSDYTPPSGQLPGTSVLRRIDGDGTSTRLGADATLFVRRGVAFRLGQVVQLPLTGADGGAILGPDGGPTFVGRASALEALPLDGGAPLWSLPVSTEGVCGAAVDGERLYLVEGDRAPTLRAEPLPKVLRSP